MKELTQRVQSEAAKAKTGLIERGYSAEKVDDMSDGQAVLLYTSVTYNEIRDELFKWM